MCSLPQKKEGGHKGGNWDQQLLVLKTLLGLQVNLFAKQREDYGDLNSDLSLRDSSRGLRRSKLFPMGTCEPCNDTGVRLQKGEKSTCLRALKSERRRRVPEGWCTKGNPWGWERPAVRTWNEGHTYPFLSISTATQRPCPLQAEGRLRGKGTAGHISLQPDDRLRMCTQQVLGTGRTQLGHKCTNFQCPFQKYTTVQYSLLLPIPRLYCSKSWVSIFIRHTLSDSEQFCIFVLSSIPLP